MPIYKKNGKAVLFAHIPKSGGTTIDHIFLSNGWRVAFQDGGGGLDSILGHLRCSFQHFHADLLAQSLKLNSFDAVFTVLRDPLARLQSEYRWGIQHGADPQLGFDAWVRQMFRSYLKNPFVMDNHIRPQCQFVLPGAQVTALESGIAKTMEGLSQTLGEPFRYDLDSQRNKSKVMQDPLQVSRLTAWRIRMFYARDFALHRRALSE